MSLKYNLKYLFNPKSIALIGASREKGSVGYSILKNLKTGCVFSSQFCKPFRGKLYAVNPNTKKILGIKCYSSILNIKEKIDLAVIAVPSKIVLKIVKECIKKRVKAIIIISSGFAETGAEGKKVQQEIVSLLKKAKIPMLGPNCLGIIKPSSCLNASFAPAMPKEGEIAFISQSGALIDSVVDWSIENNYGFSSIVSFGNEAMLGVCEFLKYFKNDKETKVIVLYIEGLKDGRRFMKIAKEVSEVKPVIVVKAGKTKEGVRAAKSHTASIAGDYEIYKAAFKQSNVFLADSLEELFDGAKALAMQPVLKGGIAIVTNGGGAGVLCTDYCLEYGIPLVKLKKETIKKLDKTKIFHYAYSRKNPLDIVGDASAEQYKTAIEILIKEQYIHGLIVIVTLQSMTDLEKIAKEVIKIKNNEKPIIFACMLGKFSKKAIQLLEKRGVPVYNDVKRAARAMKFLYERGLINSKS